MRKRWLGFGLEALSLPTAPTREQAVAGWVRLSAERLGMRVRRDAWGNLLVHYRRGAPLKRPTAFCAHMDHPGFVAERMLDHETLAAQWRGAVPQELFAGARVRFFSDGRWTRGEVLAASRKYEPGRFRATRIRVARTVEPGSVGMWDFPDPYARGSRLFARGHDDVAGVAAIMCALDELHRRAVETEVYALFTRFEEGGLFGAMGACRSRTLPRKCVILALETSMALPNARLGDGVVVRVGDRSSIFTPWVTAMAADAADALAGKARGFRFQRRLMDGGVCESTIYTGHGYDAGGLCLPLGNYHNVNRRRMKLGPEYIDLNDYESLIRLMLELAVRGGEYRFVDPSQTWKDAFDNAGPGLRRSAGEF